MIEAIKTLGSFVGLLTGLVVFYDRLVKGRPIASLTTTHNGRACIRISNPSSYDIAVLAAKVLPPVYSLGDDDLLSAITAAVDVVPSFMLKPFMLKPGEAKELTLVPIPIYKDNLPLDPTPQRVTIKISWLRGNSTWLWQAPVCVCTTTKTVREFQGRPL
jgi:hypothetical protein